MTTPPNRVAESGALAPPPSFVALLVPTIPPLPQDLPISGPYVEIFGFAGTAEAGQRVAVCVQAQLLNGDVNTHGVQAQIQTTGLVSVGSIDYPGFDMLAGETALFPIVQLFEVDAPGGAFTISIGYRANGAGPDAIAPCGGYALILD